MKLLYLSASNLFGLASNAEFDFTESDLIALTGANGSGKSSLMDAVRTACFGEASPARNVSLKDYISRGSSSASVCMEFLDRDDVKLRVTRNFTKNSKGAVSGDALLEEYRNGVWEGIGGGVSEVNEKIAERILPAPPQPGKTPGEILKQAKSSFDVAALVSQGNINKILSLSPGDLFDLISSALDVRGGEILKSESKELKRVAEEETERLGARISGLEDSLSGLKSKEELIEELAREQSRRGKIAAEVTAVEEQAAATKEIASAASALLEAQDRYKRLEAESSDSVRRCYLGEVRFTLDSLKDSCTRYGLELKKVTEAKEALVRLSGEKSEQERKLKDAMDEKTTLDGKFESLSKLSALYGILSQIKETEAEIEKAESDLKEAGKNMKLVEDKEVECGSRMSRALSAKYSLAIRKSEAASEGLKTKISGKEEVIVESLKETLFGLSDGGIIDLNKMDFSRAEEFLKKMMRSSFTVNLKEIGGLQEELKRELKKIDELRAEAESLSVQLWNIPEDTPAETIEKKLDEAEAAVKKLDEAKAYIDNKKTELHGKTSALEESLKRSHQRMENFRAAVHDSLDGAPEPSLEACRTAKDEAAAINVQRREASKKADMHNAAVHATEQKIAAYTASIKSFEESGKAVRTEDIASKKNSVMQAVTDAVTGLKLPMSDIFTEAKKFDVRKSVPRSRLDAILKDLSAADRAAKDQSKRLDTLLDEYKKSGYVVPECDAGSPDAVSHAYFSAYYNLKVKTENLRVELSELDSGIGRLKGDLDKRESVQGLIDSEKSKYEAMLAPLSYARECAKLADGSNFTRYVSDRIMEILLDGVNASLYNLGTGWTISSDGGKLAVDDGSGEVRPVAGMSGGEKTLISLLLLRSISNYGLLWIDEGLAMLDEGRLAGILETIADSGDTKQIIFATHDQDLARSFPVMWNMRNGVKETLENEPLSVTEEIVR